MNAASLQTLAFKLKRPITQVQPRRAASMPINT